MLTKILTYKYTSKFELLVINQDCLLLSTFIYLKFCVEKNGRRTLRPRSEIEEQKVCLFTGFLGGEG
jgi:hypothetical protein